MKVFVLCRSEEVARQWRERGALYEGIEIDTGVGYSSFYTYINEVIGRGGDAPAVICHDDVWFGTEFARLVGELVADLDRDWPNWGVCGNAGVQWDGGATYRHLYDPHGGPQRAAGSKPALGIDGNMMLLNLPRIRDAGVRVPELGGFHGYDFILSLECLRGGLAVLVDQRLLTMHLSKGDGGGFDSFGRSETFQRYFGERFVNNHLCTINGLIDTSGAVSYDYVASPGTRTEQADVIRLFDNALASARRDRRPVVTIVCRTQLNRPEMLTRAVTSFAVAANEAPDLVHLAVRIVSDRSAEQLDAEMGRLKALAPALDLEGWHLTVREGRHSRVDLLLGAIERAEGDYLWFVDDDDFVVPASLRPIGRAVQTGRPFLVVGNSSHYDEEWSNGDGPRTLKSSRFARTLPAGGVFTALMGDNATPICSILFPTSVMRERTADVRARGDYYEDFFLLLRALTAHGVEVLPINATFCGISVRGTENTIGAVDRSRWHLSYATFMGELLSRGDDTPFMWQLASRQSQAPAYAAITAGAATVPWSVRRAIQIAYAARAAVRLVRRPREAVELGRRFAAKARTDGLKSALIALVNFSSRI